MPKVSVIVPVYGVEKYIERCARSLFEQTLEDIEYIFVDDCTKDDSICILKRVIEDYPQRTSQIMILHHDVNKGLPQARKTGVEASHGEFIAHCDSDDWVDKRMYELMYEEGEKTGADIIICDYFRSDGINSTIHTEKHSDKNTDLVLNMMYERESWAVWDKLVRKEIFDNPLFVYPKDSMAEDMVISIQAALYSKKICSVNTPLYYYFVNSESMSRQKSISKRIRLFEEACRNVEIVENRVLALNEKCYDDGIVYLKSLQRNLLLPVIKYTAVAEMWKKRFPKLGRKVIFSLHIPIRHKLRMIYTYFLICFYRKKNEDETCKC